MKNFKITDFVLFSSAIQRFMWISLQSKVFSEDTPFTDEKYLKKDIIYERLVVQLPLLRYCQWYRSDK